MAEKILSFTNNADRDKIISQQKALAKPFFEKSNTQNSDGSGSITFTDTLQTPNPKRILTQTQFIAELAEIHGITVV